MRCTGVTDDQTKCEASRYLDDILESFLVTWSVTDESKAVDTGSTAASREQIMSRTRVRARKALEKLFKAQPSEVIASVVQVWASQSTDINVRQCHSFTDAQDSAIFDCVDVLAPSAQKAVDLVCEHMAGKGRGSIER